MVLQGHISAERRVSVELIYAFPMVHSRKFIQFFLTGRLINSVQISFELSKDLKVKFSKKLIDLIFSGFVRFCSSHDQMTAVFLLMLRKDIHFTLVLSRNPKYVNCARIGFNFFELLPALKRSL